MNGNMNLGKRVTLLEKGSGTDIKKEISELKNAVEVAQEEITNLENKVNSVHAYSTEEKVVATWIDGRPVYGRTIYGTATSNNTWLDSGIIIQNVDVFMTREKSIRYPVDLDVYEDRLNVMIVPSTGVFKVRQNVSSSSVEYTFYVVLHYTKTTDNPTIKKER